MIINELKTQIENNLFRLDNMVDLLFTNEYQDSDELRELIENLSEETKMIQNKLNKLVNHAS